jgi:hypothetical protein
MGKYFPPFFSLNLKLGKGLSGFRGWQYVVVAVSAVVFAFFLLLKENWSPEAPANPCCSTFADLALFFLLNGRS